MSTIARGSTIVLRLVIVLLVGAMAGILLWGYLNGNVFMSRASSLQLDTTHVYFKSSEDHRYTAQVGTTQQVRLNVSPGIAVSGLDITLLYNAGDSDIIESITLRDSYTLGDDQDGDYFHSVIEEDGRDERDGVMRKRYVLTALRQTDQLGKSVALVFDVNMKMAGTTRLYVEGCTFQVVGKDGKGIVQDGRLVATEAHAVLSVEEQVQGVRGYAQAVSDEYRRNVAPSRGEVEVLGVAIGDEGSIDPQYCKGELLVPDMDDLQAQVEESVNVGSCQDSDCISFYLLADFADVADEVDVPISARVYLRSRGGNKTNEEWVMFHRDGDVWKTARPLVFTPDEGANEYRLYVKGERHIKQEICSVVPSLLRDDDYACNGDYIGLSSLVGTIDISARRQRAGDLPLAGLSFSDGGVSSHQASVDDSVMVSANGQDGVVNSEDMAFIRTYLGTNSDDYDNGEEDDASMLKAIRICDSNYDGRCDISDYKIVKNMLESGNVHDVSDE